MGSGNIPAGLELLNDEAAMASLDPGGMGRAIWELPGQCRRAQELAAAAPLPAGPAPARTVVLGMGGSAIGGDLVRGLHEAQSPAAPLVHRGYAVPAWVGADTLAIASSYSGNTEETLSAAEAAVAGGARLAALTTGGELARRARERGWPLVQVPAGLQPRAAIGYSVVPLLVLLARCGVIPDPAPGLAEAAALLEAKREEWGPRAAAGRNGAKDLARSLFGKVLVVYGAEGWTAPLAYRWKCQINENAKSLAFWATLPEANHNELVGWEGPPEAVARVACVFLRDRAEAPPMAARFAATRRLLEARKVAVYEVWSEGDSPLARLFSLLYLGDYASYYLALLARHDPTPVRAIEALKEELAAGRRPPGSLT